MSRIIFSVPAELERRLRRSAAERGVSLAEFIRQAVEEKVSQERPKPRLGLFESSSADTARLAGARPAPGRSLSHIMGRDGPPDTKAT